MGGRGGAGASRGGASPDGAISLNSNKLKVERLTGSFGSDAMVLSATTDGKGNLTLQNASATGYRQQNRNTSYAQYELSAGITNRTATGKTQEIASHNINWNKVKSVSGKTYGTQILMKEKGFKWDSTAKIWTK